MRPAPPPSPFAGLAVAAGAASPALAAHRGPRAWTLNVEGVVSALEDGSTTIDAVRAAREWVGDDDEVTVAVAGTTRYTTARRLVRSVDDVRIGDQGAVKRAQDNN